jgi:ankyrin repeat protein
MLDLDDWDAKPQARAMRGLRWVTVGVWLAAAVTGCKKPIADDPKLSPLMNAARVNDIERARRLIRSGADVREKTGLGQTALYEAIERQIREDNVPMVRLLLDSGVDPREKMIFGQSALNLSMSRDYANPEVTLLLIQRGAEVERGCPLDGDGQVAAATMESSVAVMRALLTRGASPNCQFRGMTALHWAALNGQADRVAVLLAGGADANIKNIRGQTALDVATTTNPDARVQADFEKTRQRLHQAK